MRLLGFSVAMLLFAAGLCWASANDQQIAQGITNRFKQEQQQGNLRGFDINLRVAEGKVVLEGHVASAEQLALAERIAKDVAGVTEVSNQLSIRAGQPDSRPAETSAPSQYLPPVHWDAGKGEATQAAAKPGQEMLDKRTADRQIADELAQRLRTLKESGELKGFRINVDVTSGVVRLQGTVSEESHRALVLQNTKSISGVGEVIDEMVMRNSQPPAPQTNVAATIPAQEPATPVENAIFRGESVATADSQAGTSDSQIGEELTALLQKAKENGSLQGFGINVNVERGNVTLKGHVASEQQQRLALDLARRLPGVQQVVNELAVAPSQIDPAAARNIAQLLSQRLEAAESLGRLAGARIDAKVDGSRILLNGQVASPAQAQMAVELARQIPGVTEVENNLIATEPSRFVAKIDPSAAAAMAIPVPTVSQPGRLAPTLASAGQERPLPMGQPVAIDSMMAANLAAASAIQPVLPAMHAMPPGQLGGAPMNTGSFIPASETPLPSGVARLASCTAGACVAPFAIAGQMAGVMPAQLPGPGYANVPARYDHPNLPGYAWPSYAAYPNYAAVTYPKQYSPSAWPYIGPFYPYPQVPLGWRKVTLKWDDGWWMLDFNAK